MSTPSSGAPQVRGAHSRSSPSHMDSCGPTHVRSMDTHMDRDIGTCCQMDTWVFGHMHEHMGIHVVVDTVEMLQDMVWTLHGWKMGFLGPMNCSCLGISYGTKGYLPPQKSPSALSHGKPSHLSQAVLTTSKSSRLSLSYVPRTLIGPICSAPWGRSQGLEEGAAGSHDLPFLHAHKGWGISVSRGPTDSKSPVL